MKFLCLAYGDGKDWEVLSKEEQDALLAQDAVLRRRGDLVASVEQKATTLTAWDGNPSTSNGSFTTSRAPLAGFGIIDAADLDEVLKLVTHTPCARAKGAIEVRPISGMNEPGKEKTTTENRTATEEAQIRALLDARAKAVRSKDVDGTLANVAADIILFDVVNPLQHIGSGGSRARAEDWFASFEGPIGFEICELSVTAGDDVAFCHGLNHVEATRKDRGKVDMFWRATVCCRKIGGKWMITHEHNSVPFDMETGKASLSLKP
ncbi:MAG: nuclear transport factor 2 family protein [Bryobacteraceae bacterium]